MSEPNSELKPLDNISIQQAVNDRLRQYGLCFFVSHDIRLHRWNKTKLSWGRALTQKEEVKAFEKLVPRSSLTRTPRRSARWNNSARFISTSPACQDHKCSQ